MAGHARSGDPFLLHPPPLCLACGYDLEGIAAPGACPECGQRFPGAYLVVHGIVQRSGRGRTRTWIWVTLAVAWYLMSTAGVVLAIAYDPRVAAGLALVLVASVVLMLITSRRDRRGIEQLIFSCGLVGGRSIKKDKAESGEADRVEPGLAFELRRTSSVWRTLRVGTPAGGRVRRPVFIAGFRCQDHDEAMVRAHVAEALSSTDVG